MLAEKRYKQKWSEDPRNTRWSEGSTVLVTLCLCGGLPFYCNALLCLPLSRQEQVRVPYAGADGLDGRSGIRERPGRQDGTREGAEKIQ